MEQGTSPVYSAQPAAAALAVRTGAPAALREALLAARERTLRLAEDFRAALGPQPHVPYAAELNPPLWELGHVAWFQEWWVGRNPDRALGVGARGGAPRSASLLPGSDALYDSGRVGHRTRWALVLPEPEETDRYLRQTLEDTLEALDRLQPDAGDDALYFFRLAAQHEQMHAEAAVMMAQGLGIALRECGAPAVAGAGTELLVGADALRLGDPQPGFAFDNELGAHEVELAAYAIDAEPVTWGAYLPFVEGGGYEDLRWWTPQGRAWLATLRLRQPANLRRAGGGWEQFRHGTWHPLHAAQVAVHLNAHEADAWCAWARRRLPTEAEWEHAALTQPGFRWGAAWEWTASRFQPYPGFVPHPYADYSAPWFGSRRVLRGASTATAAAMAHPRYRNFYEPHRRDVLAGFRSARTQDGTKPSGV